MKDPESYLIMQKPEFKSRVVELKNSGEYATWKDISLKLKEEFGKEVSESALQGVYKKTLATTITVDTVAQKNFTHLIDTLRERFERMVQRTEVLAQAFDEFLYEIEDNDKMTTIEKATAKLKVLDALEKLQKIFNAQMTTVMDEIDKIKVEQSKMIYDDNMVIRKINESLPLILKDLELKGKVSILDPQLFE